MTEENTTQILTAKEYAEAVQKERNATDPRVLRAYELQDRMQRAKKHYEELKEEFHQLLGEVGPYKNDYYSVSNLKRAPRKIDMTLLRKNFPDLARDKAVPSEKYIVTALIEEFGKDTLLRMAYDHDPEGYENAKTLSITDFDKATGDSSKKFLYAGKAYQERWIEDKNEPLSITYIGKTQISEFTGKHERHPDYLKPSEDDWDGYDAMQAEAAGMAEAEARAEAEFNAEMAYCGNDGGRA